MEKDFVPALGIHGLERAYDRVVALATRERTWRAELLRLVAPAPSDRLLDVGCGTGTFALMVARACPEARVVGVDPDPAVLALARAKLGGAVAWHRAYGDELAETLGAGSMTKVASSLVLHQCDLGTKRAIVRSMFEVLAPGGRLFVADYGRQRTLLMRTLFLPVRLLDGAARTQPNTDGELPSWLEEAGFENVRETSVLATPTGSISLYRAERV